MDHAQFNVALSVYENKGKIGLSMMSLCFVGGLNIVGFLLVFSVSLRCFKFVQSSACLCNARCMLDSILYFGVNIRFTTLSFTLTVIDVRPLM